MRKKVIIKLSIYFIFIVIVFTFFSSTIYNLTLPNVIVAFAENATITQKLNEEGIVELKDEQLYYASNSGNVKLKLKKGDIVSKGFEIFSIDFDDEELKDNNYKLEIQKNKIAKLNSDILYYKTELDNLIKQGAKEENINIEDYDNKINSSALEIENLKQQLNTIENSSQNEYDIQMDKILSELFYLEQQLENFNKLYELGSVSKDEVDNLKKEIDRLNFDYDKLNNDKTEEIKNLKLQIEKTQKNFEALKTQKDYAVAQNNKNNEVNFKDYESRLNELKNTISNLENDLNEAQIEQDFIQKAIDDIQDSFNQKFVADDTCVITEIVAPNGSHVNKNDLILKTGKVFKDYQLKIKTSNKNNWITTYTPAKININSTKETNLSGAIKSIKSVEGEIEILIEFSSNRALGGELADVSLQEISQLQACVIPNSALRNDSGGDYIFIVEKKKGIIGEEYYAKRVKVNIMSYDSQYTSIENLVDTSEAIIINSDKTISEGERIKLSNGSDIDAIR